MSERPPLDLVLQLEQAGRWAEAEALCRQLLGRWPDWAEVWQELGSIRLALGQITAAIEALARAVQLAPGSPAAWYKLGAALYAARRLDQAVGSYRNALRLDPSFFSACLDLGNALLRQGNIEAIEWYTKAISIQPDASAAHFNLAQALKQWRCTDQAICSYRAAITNAPEFGDAYHGLGEALGSVGQVEEALACQRRAVALRPGDASMHSALLWSLHFHPSLDITAIRAEHEVFDLRHARPLASKILPHANDRSADRRLRIGYVSPCFRNHVIGWLTAAILSQHDRDRFDVVCYADVLRNRIDEHSNAIMRSAHKWRETISLSDEQFARQVREDRIDILVDLNLHMVPNRMLAFARKPAPVQVTYLGYPATTGLRTMDYRLTEAHLSPPGQPAEGPERLAFLPVYWPYTAHCEAPEVNDLPALRRPQITFSCLNSFRKVNTGVIALWSRIMGLVPNSRLHMLIEGGSGNEHVYEAFERQGIDRQRIALLQVREPAEYLRLYHDVDIALDPFPYNGHTTSHDAIYMGVPLVTLAGTRAVSRAGVSILSNLGLSELIARTEDEYVQIVLELARDVDRLSQLRHTLRERLRQSPLMDTARLVRGLEGAYRKMWSDWLSQR